MTLPANVSPGDSDHDDHHDKIHTRYNALTPGGVATEQIPANVLGNAAANLTVPPDQYPTTSTGPIAEMYNMMMAHFDGARATSMFVNVQHPDFGATGRNANHLNEAPAIQEAIDFIVYGPFVGARSLWFPSVGDTHGRARYYVDVPLRLHTGLRWWAYGARIAASPRFDFVTPLPTQNWGTYPQAVIESYNDEVGADPPGRLSLARMSLNGGLIEGMSIAGSRGATVNLQQQTSWQGVRFDTCDIGIVIGGQQGIFHDLMVTTDFANPPSAAKPYIGIQLGIDVSDVPGAPPAFPASFFWFYGGNVEGCYRAVKQLHGLGANVFRDIHFEGDSTADSANPAHCFTLTSGQLVVDEAYWSSTGGNPLREHGTFLHNDGTTGSYHLKDIFIQCNGATSPPVFVNDPFAGHLIKAWGQTQPSVGEEGIVRHIQELIRPRGGGPQPRRHVITILHKGGGYTALGSFDDTTPAASQLPLLTLRPGATQMGHLVSYYDKTGTERYVVTADGLPKLPAYTAVTRPSAVGRRAVMIYFLDTNKVQISDNTTWQNLH